MAPRNRGRRTANRRVARISGGYRALQGEPSHVQVSRTVYVDIDTVANAWKTVLASAVLTADAGTSGYTRLIVHSVRAYTITLPSDREYSSIILDPGVRSGTNDAWRVTGIARDTISRASAGYVVPLADRDNWDASWGIVRIMSNCTRVRLAVTGQFL